MVKGLGSLWGIFWEFLHAREKLAEARQPRRLALVLFVVYPHAMKGAP